MLFLRLLISGLHHLGTAFPSFIYQGTLFRAETGVRSNWDEVMVEGGIIYYYTPTSFTSDPKAIKVFKPTAEDVADADEPDTTRTVTRIIDGSGYRLRSISLKA